MSLFSRDSKEMYKKGVPRAKLLFCSLNLLFYWRSSCRRRRRFVRFLLRLGLKPNPNSNPLRLGLNPNGNPNRLGLGFKPNTHSNPLGLGLNPNPNPLGQGLILTLTLTLTLSLTLIPWC